MKKNIPQDKIKTVNLVFFQYRDRKTLEINGHFCPITNMKRFTATRYLLKNPKGGSNYSLYVATVLCHFCGKKFKRNSDNFIQHVDTCLKDNPTFYSLPAEGSEYTFRNFENAIPSAFTIICDLESENIDRKFVCGFCDAKLEFETDRENAIKIWKNCDHPKERFKSCSTCTLKVLRLRKQAVITCEREQHLIQEDGVDVCKECEKKLKKNEDRVIHDTTHVIPCQICSESESQYCIHGGSQTVRTLAPLIYSAVVIDNITGRVRSTTTYGGENPITDLFEYLDDLRPTLEAEHGAR